MALRASIAPGDKSLTFDIIFNTRDADRLEQHLLEIVHHQSKWLSEEEIASYIAPSADVKTTVELAIKGLEPLNMLYSRDGGALTITTAIAKVAGARSWASYGAIAETFVISTL